MAQNVGDTTARTFADLVTGPIVDIYVGETKRHWPLHRNLLAYHSEYLQSELQQSPDSSPKKKGLPDNLRLDLPDDDPLGFELLVKWLYQGKIEDVSNIVEDQDKYEYAVACQKLHQLCERLEFPRLKNIAMDQYRKGLNQAGLVPDAEELNVIYRQSVEQSPFRKLMVSIAARQIMDPESDKDAESYRHCFENNSDFAVDLVNAIKKGMGGLLFEDPTEKNDCEYHDHNEGPNCHVRGKKKLGSSTPQIHPLRDQQTSHSRHTKAVSRSVFSSRQTPSPTPPAARHERPATPPATPHLNGFAETYDRDPAGGRPDVGPDAETDYDQHTHDQYENEGEEEDAEDDEDDDFRSAVSEAGTTYTSYSRTNPSRILNSPRPGRRTPRKLARRSLGASERESPPEHAISEHGEGDAKESQGQDTIREGGEPDLGLGETG